MDAQAADAREARGHHHATRAVELTQPSSRAQRGIFSILHPLLHRLTDHPAERWLRLIPTIAYMTLIYGVSAVPGQNLPSLADDRILHFGEYFVLAVLMLFSVIAWTPRGAVAWSWFLSSAYAATDEWHQSFVSGRDSSLRDVAFDVLGISVALGVLVLLLRQSTR